MGCGSSTGTNVSAITPTSEYHAAINAELAPFLSLESPYNINHKYNHFFILSKSEEVGTGIRKTNAYKSKLPLEEVQAKRVEFWETRVEGKERSWKALRAACEGNDVDAIKFLAAAHVKLVNNTLQLSFDSEGNKYDVPAFCINDPSKYDLPKKKEVKKEELTGQLFNVKFRNAGVPQDVKMEIADNMTVLEIKEEYIKKLNEEGLQPSHLRFFFGGKEFNESSLIAEYNVRDDLVIQVFRRKV